MRGNRLLHALTVTGKGHFWDDVYSRVSEQPEGIPFNILLTYYYFQKTCGKTLVEQVEVLKRYNFITNGGKILLDSGIYSFNVRHGVDIRKYSTETTREGLDLIAKEGKSSLPLCKDYVDEYAKFLAMSENYWDYAFDFDADIFLGSKITDELHERLIERSGVDRSRFIRVYHIARPNTDTWWKTMCEDDRYEYLAIEGGTIHKWDPAFYNPLVDLAHTNNKKVHILAVSPLSLTREVPVDTFDNTTHLIGGRFGTLLTPWGQIDFSRGKIRPPSYEDLSDAAQKDICNYLSNLGLSIEEIIESPYSRNLANIWFMNKYWDLPYVKKSKTLPLFDILEV